MSALLNQLDFFVFIFIFIFIFIFFGEGGGRRRTRSPPSRHVVIAAPVDLNALHARLDAAPACGERPIAADFPRSTALTGGNNLLLLGIRSLCRRSR